MAAKKPDSGDRVKPPKSATQAAGGRKADPSTRARKLTKLERVRLIADRMADGTWVTGHTFRELAIEWGIHPDTVKKDSAEASRFFAYDDEERSTRKARWLAQIESAKANARRLKRCEAEARFLELQGKAEGFFEPEKVELSGSLGDLLSLATDRSGDSSDEPVEG